MGTEAPSLTPEEETRVQRVLDRLRSAGGSTGFVPFDRFMEIALYSEGAGFYSREAPVFGRSGDYYTAVHVSPLFGETLAARVGAVRQTLGPRRPFRVVEAGPGDGTLATTVLSALAPKSLGSKGVEYVLVERSASLQRAALERARAAGEAAGIEVRVAESVGADGPFEGVVVANEFLDAQPARRLEWDGASWKELGVRVVEDRLLPATEPLVSPLPPPDLPSPTEPGTVVEVSPAAEGFVREVADHVVRGLLILVDYGMEEAELVAGHSSGTLAGVRHHRFVGDPLSTPGALDLSVFVNFSRVRAAAKRAGLTEVTYSSQAEALGSWGFSALFDRAIRGAGSAEAEVRLKLAAKKLLFGFERFRVLELAAPLDAERVRAATSPAVSDRG